MNKCKVKLKTIDHIIILDIESIKTGQISEADIEGMWCIYCGAKCHIYHFSNGNISFRSDKHKDKCDAITKYGEDDEKLSVKRIRIAQFGTINHDLILFGHDRAPTVKNTGGSDGADKPTKEFPDGTNIVVDQTPDSLDKKETAYYNVWKTKNVECIQTLFREIKDRGYNFDMGDGRNASDLLLDEMALHSIRRTGFNGLKIALLKRCSKEDFEYLNKCGVIPHGRHRRVDYIILKDAFSTKPENTLFFRLKCQNNDQNNYFKTKIMGNTLKKIEKDKRPYIVVYTYFKRVTHDYVHLYEAEITFRQYGLFSNIDIKGN